MNIIVSGSLGFDYIMDFPGIFADRIMPDKIHQISLSFLVDDLKKQWGGTAGNISYTLGLLKSKPLLFATAGTDFAPYKQFLTKNGVDTSFVKEYADISTGSYFVITDKADNQIGAFYTGAMCYAHELSLKNTISHARPGLAWLDPFVVIAPNDPTAMKKYVDECIELKTPYMYDPAFQIDTFSKSELLKGVSHAQILIGNDYEIEMIIKKLEITHDELLEKVPIVVTTLGSKGARIHCHSREGGRHHEMGSIPVVNLYKWIPDPASQGEQVRDDTIQIKPAKANKVVDPTGAGDCFRAGFLAGYLRGFDLQTCGQMGAVAAVYSVEEYGTTTHTFTTAEFARRYFKNYHTKLPGKNDAHFY